MNNASGGAKSELKKKIKKLFNRTKFQNQEEVGYMKRTQKSKVVR